MAAGQLGSCCPHPAEAVTVGLRCPRQPPAQGWMGPPPVQPLAPRPGSGAAGHGREGEAGAPEVSTEGSRHRSAPSQLALLRRQLSRDTNCLSTQVTCSKNELVTAGHLYHLIGSCCLQRRNP